MSSASFSSCGSAWRRAVRLAAASAACVQRSRHLAKFACGCSLAHASIAAGISVPSSAVAAVAAADPIDVAAAAASIASDVPRYT